MKKLKKLLPFTGKGTEKPLHSGEICGVPFEGLLFSSQRYKQLKSGPTTTDIKSVNFNALKFFGKVVSPVYCLIIVYR